MPLVRKRSRWRAYNLRRANGRAADTARRRANAQAKRELREAVEVAQAKAFIDTTPRSKPLALKIRLSIAGHSHQLTTVWLGEGFGWSLPHSRIATGLRELMANAPRVAAA